MANTYTLIGSTTATNGTSISFTSIPQTYTDLQLVISAKTTYNGGGGSLSLAIAFNSTGTNYSSKYIQYYGTSTVISGSDTTTTMGGITGGILRAVMVSSFDSTVTSTFGNSSIYIPNYTSSNNKPYSVEGAVEANSSASNGVQGLAMTAGLWSNSAAITRIDLGAEVGNFVSPSTFYLYGIKNS